MEDIIEEIKRLCTTEMNFTPLRIEKIPQSGSDRLYFRVYSDDTTYIATHGRNVRENETFIYFSRHFKKYNSPVPNIFAVNKEVTVYIQEDFGNISLLNKLEELGKCEEVLDLFRLSLKELTYLQIKGDQLLDYSKCITSKEFGKQAILSDLLYFKYYFLDTLQVPYDKEKLLEEFDQFATYLTGSKHKHFMFRDFQSRNIMIHNNNIHFIDYQGGMKGALQYDVASLLWQARAELPDDWKVLLLDYYMDRVEENLSEKIDRQIFSQQYYGYVLIRLLQVMGAYGFRGLFERKAHFLTSIPLGLKNIASFLKIIPRLPSQNNMGLPEFERLLNIIISDDIVNRFSPTQATENTPLVVRISSFSYKKGIPQDVSGNGGGFVFDCRGILNPGRFEEYKKFTGRDKSVQDFLEQKTKIAEFLNSVYSIIDISVEDYIKRGFTDLQINFGCTGGQHRSVFAADNLARHLRNKYKVKIELHHREQEERNWIN